MGGAVGAVIVAVVRRGLISNVDGLGALGMAPGAALDKKTVL